MKRFLLVINLFMVIWLSMSLYYDNHSDKIIHKTVSNVFGKEKLELLTIHIPDSLKSELTILKRITYDKKVKGYACLTTAFGCRVGGCAAPGNPNVQSYETFDYVVVYDTNFNIVKLDIVNFGGEYGYEICRKNWLEQFENKNKDFVLNENIDGITGATVSAQYLINDLNVVGPSVQLIVEKYSAELNSSLQHKTGDAKKSPRQ